LCWQRPCCDAKDKITIIANLHTKLEEACRENEHVRLEINRLYEQLDGVNVYFKMRKDDLRRTKEKCDNHRAAAEQMAKEAEQVSAALHGKDRELQQERAALGEAKS
jgi:regulator of replication initiation timing